MIGKEDASKKQGLARREVTSGHSGHTLIPYSFRHPIYSIYNLMEYL
jgi:hypothetical protein